MIGYVQLYFRIEGENGNYYLCFNGDFSKPLTRFRLLRIKWSMKKACGIYDIIHSVHFCSKKEWDENHCGSEIIVSWGQRDA